MLNQREEGLGQRAIRGVFWTAVGNWGDQLTTFVVFVILSRLLTPVAFGVVALASVFTRLVKILAEQGLADAIVQHPDPDRRHLDTAFWASVITGTTLTALLAATAGWTARLVNEPELAPVLATLSLTVLVAGLGSVPIAVLTRDMAFGSLTARKLLSVVVSGVVGVGCAVAGLGVWSLVALSLTSEVVGVATLWRVVDWRPGFRFSSAHLGQMLRFGGNVVGFRFMNFLKKRSDNLLIGSFLGSAALGFYTVGYRLLNILISVTTEILGRVAFPVFSRTQQDQHKTQMAFYKAVRHASLVAFPAFTGLIVLAPELTRLLFGARWLPSVPVMRVIAVAGLLQSVMFVNGILLKALGKPSWRMMITTLEAAAAVAAFLVAVRWGIVAVAAAAVVVNTVSAPLTLAATHRLMPLDLGHYLRQIRPGFGASVGMAAIVLLTKPLVAGVPLPWRVAALVILGVVTYGGSLWVFARPTAEEALRLARLALPTRRSRRSIDQVEPDPGETWRDEQPVVVKGDRGASSG